MTALLVRKCESVFQTYSHLYEKDLAGPDVNLDLKDQRLFDSMERHHKNSHTSAEEWLDMFHQKKSNLGTKEKMNDLSEDFVSFLDSKFVESDVRKQFHTPDFLDHLDDNIRKYHRVLLCERDEQLDEFNFHLVDGIQSKDIIFFTRRFFPAALFFTYSMNHPDSDPKDLMEDLFSIGAGSMTMTLIPETTGICVDCYSDRFQGVPNKILSLEQITKLNKIVFRAQQADRFVSEFRYYSDSSNEDETEGLDIVDNNEDEDLDDLLESLPGSNSKDENLSVFEFNPFVVNKSDTSSTNIFTKEDVLKSHACIHCGKAFSREEFVNMHVDIFHGSVKKVVPRFVNDGEELITSFVENKEICENVKKVKQMLKFRRKRL